MINYDFAAVPAVLGGGIRVNGTRAEVKEVKEGGDHGMVVKGRATAVVATVGEGGSRAVEEMQARASSSMDTRPDSMRVDQDGLGGTTSDNPIPSTSSSAVPPQLSSTNPDPTHWSHYQVSLAPPPPPAIPAPPSPPVVRKPALSEFELRNPGRTSRARGQDNRPAETNSERRTRGRRALEDRIRRQVEEEVHRRLAGLSDSYRPMERRAESRGTSGSDGGRSGRRRRIEESEEESDEEDYRRELSRRSTGRESTREREREDLRRDSSKRSTGRESKRDGEQEEHRRESSRRSIQRDSTRDREREDLQRDSSSRSTGRESTREGEREDRRRDSSKRSIERESTREGKRRRLDDDPEPTRPEQRLEDDRPPPRESPRVASSRALPSLPIASKSTARLPGLPDHSLARPRWYPVKAFDTIAPARRIDSRKSPERLSTKPNDTPTEPRRSPGHSDTLENSCRVRDDRMEVARIATSNGPTRDQPGTTSNSSSVQPINAPSTIANPRPRFPAQPPSGLIARQLRQIAVQSVAVLVDDSRRPPAPTPNPHARLYPWKWKSASSQPVDSRIKQETSSRPTLPEVPSGRESVEGHAQSSRSDRSSGDSYTTSSYTSTAPTTASNASTSDRHPTARVRTPVETDSRGSRNVLVPDREEDIKPFKREVIDLTGDETDEEKPRVSAEKKAMETLRTHRSSSRDVKPDRRELDRTRGTNPPASQAPRRFPTNAELLRGGSIPVDRERVASGDWFR